MATKERLQGLLEQIIGLIKEERKLSMIKRCHDCNKIMDGVPLAIGTYHCWDCIDE